MADDKTKKPADKTPEGVEKALVACGLSTDASSRHITSALIADNLANGAKGVNAITSSARGLSPSIGQCVADQYEDRKPSLGERFTSYFNGASAKVSEATASAKMVAGMVAEPLVMGSVNVVTHDTPDTLKARPALINKASSPDASR